MPSCVIKCCKNHSSRERHSTQITFHKFPNDRMCKRNWIKAVRGNRNDANWLPSKFSVVCSVHFQESDIYNTKGGYRRIKKNAIPQKVHLVQSEWCQEKEQTDIQPEYIYISIPNPNGEPFSDKEKTDADNCGPSSMKPKDRIKRERTDSELDNDVNINGTTSTKLLDNIKKEIIDPEVDNISENQLSTSVMLEDDIKKEVYYSEVDNVADDNDSTSVEHANIIQNENCDPEDQNVAVSHGSTLMKSTEDVQVDMTNTDVDKVAVNHSSTSHILTVDLKNEVSYSETENVSNSHGSTSVKFTDDIQIETSDTDIDTISDNHGSTSIKLTEDIEISDSEDDNITDNHASASKKLTKDVNDEMSDSEIEAMFDDPVRHKLRTQVKKFKKLNKIHVRKIKTLYQKLRRLEKRNAELKSKLKGELKSARSKTFAKQGKKP